MIVISLPHTARHYPVTVHTSATLQSSGLYEIDAQPLFFCEMVHSSVYLIDRMSLSTTLAAGEYVAALRTADVPRVSLEYRQAAGQLATRQPITFPDYEPRQMASWMQSQRGNDALYCSFYGVMSQTDATIGIPKIEITLSADVYAVDAGWFARHYIDQLERTTGDSIRGAI